MHRALASIMPCLNRVFEEFGIHHEEHDVPAKVHKSLEDKSKKATAKNATVVAELKKRKGGGASKVTSKKQKTAATSTATSIAASTSIDEEVTENVGGGAASMGVETEGKHSVTSANLGGDNFVKTTLGGMGGGPSVEPSTAVPMPDVLGDESSDFEYGDASLLEDAKAESIGLRCPTVTPTVEVSENEAEAHFPATPFWSVALLQRRAPRMLVLRMLFGALCI